MPTTEVILAYLSKSYSRVHASNNNKFNNVQYIFERANKIRSISEYKHTHAHSHMHTRTCTQNIVQDKDKIGKAAESKEDAPRRRPVCNACEKHFAQWKEHLFETLLFMPSYIL